VVHRDGDRNESQSQARPIHLGCGRAGLADDRGRPGRSYPGRSRRRGSAHTSGATGLGTNFRQGATISAIAIIRTSGLAAPPPPADDCTLPWGPREPCGIGSPKEDGGRKPDGTGSNCGAPTVWIRRGGTSWPIDGGVEDGPATEPLPGCDGGLGRPYAATKLPVISSRSAVARRALVHPGVGTPGGGVDD
jgi:hypothetical protein